MAYSSNDKVRMASISAGKHASGDDETMSVSSAAKPDVPCVVVFYNITWDNGRFKHQNKHERTLEADIRAALDEFNADVLLLSECGEVGIGLTVSLWMSMLRRICGPGFEITHQSHYTSIIRISTIDIKVAPSLQGPLTTLPNHAYRMCQHVQVFLKGSVGKPIDLYNCHSPSSRKHPLTATVRQNILQWFLQNMGPQAIIGGDLNSSLQSLDDAFKGEPSIHYCYEAGHLHGDLAIVKGLQAESMPCEVMSTSLAHKMVVVMLTMKPAKTDQCPRWIAHEKLIADNLEYIRNAEKVVFHQSADKPESDRAAEPAKAVPTPSTIARDKLLADKEEASRLADKPESNRGADKRDVASGSEAHRSAVKPDFNRTADKRDSSSESDSHRHADKPARSPESYPLADALFKTIGQHLDADEAERTLFSELAEQLWSGNFVRDTPTGCVSQAYASKARLERMLSMAASIREKYQLQLFNVNQILDLEFNRSLTYPETTALHNAWMNDIASWMPSDCLKQYNDLIQEADERDKGKGTGRGAFKGSARKPAANFPGPRQRAQQLKKQRFNKVLSDLACKKAFFMSFVRHPCYSSAQGIRELLNNLTEVMQTKEYFDMVRDSAKKSAQESTNRRLYHQTRLAFKRGKHDYENHVKSDLAHKYASGQLENRLMRAEGDYLRKKQSGLATLLKPPQSY